MKAEIYTPKPVDQIVNVSRDVLEYSIIFIFTLAGIVGASFSFGHQGVNIAPQNYNQFSTSQAALALDVDDKPKFKDFVSISGDYKADKDLDFKILHDITDARYIMEMGDGMRIIITQKEFSYAYAAKGKYEIELKRIKRGLVSTVASKKIKIK